MSTPAVASHEALRSRVAALFGSHLSLEPPSPDIDLLETGVLDSLALVELLVVLEEEFGLEINIEELELDHFRSVGSIAEFVAQRWTPSNGNGKAAAPPSGAPRQ